MSRSKKKAAPVPEPVQDDGDDFCRVCYDGGLLLLCEKCPSAFHFDCIPQNNASCVEDLPPNWCCTMAGKACTSRTVARKMFQDGVVKRPCEMEGKGTTRGGLTYHNAFLFDGNRYTVGSTCFFAKVPPDPTGRPKGPTGEVLYEPHEVSHIGKIMSIWEDAYKDKWVEVQWYFFPEETWYGRDPARHDPREVFETAHVDEQPIMALEMAVFVLTYEQFKDPEYTSKLPKTLLYFARQRYDDDSGEFRPIFHDIRASAAAEADAALTSPPKPTRGRKPAGQQAQAPLRVHGLKRRRARDTPASAAAAAAMPSTAGDERDAIEVDMSSLTPLQAACQHLRLSAVPKKLPCRETEHNQIFDFIKSGIQRGGASTGLYISGMPGTGKTATVKQCIRELIDSAQDMPPFDFIELNAMKLPTPNHAYSYLWHALTGKLVGADTASGLLESRFSSASSVRRCCVLLIDEMDHLLGRDQNVVYNIFDWPGRRNARLVVVGISNTIDLPERLLPKVKSRFGLRSVNFLAYSHPQLQTIIKARLGDCSDVFDDEAIEYCARKVAGVSGDVRRSLQICRRAAELLQSDIDAAAAATAAASMDTSGAIEPSSGSSSSALSSSSTSSSAAAPSTPLKAGKRAKVAPASTAAAAAVPAVVTRRLIERAVSELFDTPFVQFVQVCSLHEKMFISAFIACKRDDVVSVPFSEVAERHCSLARKRGFCVTDADLPGAQTLLNICERLGSAGIFQLSFPRGASPWQPLLALVVPISEAKHALVEFDSTEPHERLAAAPLLSLSSPAVAAAASPVKTTLRNSLR